MPALANRTIAEIARETGRDPLDVFLDLGLEENLDTGFIGRFFNAVDEGSSRWSSTRPGSSRCPMPARIWSICATPGSGCISSAIGCASAAPSTCRKACAG